MAHHHHPKLPHLDPPPQPTLPTPPPPPRAFGPLLLGGVAYKSEPRPPPPVYTHILQHTANLPQFAAIYRNFSPASRPREGKRYEASCNFVPLVGDLEKALYNCHMLLSEDPTLEAQPWHEVAVVVGQNLSLAREIVRPSARFAKHLPAL